MNIYIRYFDKETLVPTVGDAIDFLESLPDIDVDDFLRKDLSQFIASDNVYPKRYKVRGRNYFSNCWGRRFYWHINGICLQCDGCCLQFGIS